MSMKAAKVSLLVVQYGDAKLLWNLLASLERHFDREIIDEVIVVNNGLALGERNRAELERYKALPVRVVDNPQKSYANGVNRGVTATQGDILVIANSDIEWLPEFSIQPLIDHLWREPSIGVVGPQLVYPDGTWQRSYGRFPSLKEVLVSLTMIDSLWHAIATFLFRYNWLPKRTKKVEYIDGAFMVVRRSCFDELGGFNEEYSFYGEDVDFCWRAWKKGWKVIFVPHVRVMHVRGASSTADALGDYTVRLVKAKQKFVERHYGARQAQWYKRFIQIAFFERSLFYSLIAKLTCSSNWQRRAIQARIRYQSIRKAELC